MSHRVHHNEVLRSAEIALALDWATRERRDLAYGLRIIRGRVPSLTLETF